MEYILNFNGRSYSLPKYTKSVKHEMERIDANNASQNLDSDKKYQGMYEFIKKMVGEESALDIFETTDMNDIDLNSITICYLGIAIAYDKPINEMNQKKSAFDSISPEDKELLKETIRNADSVERMMRKAGKQQSTTFVRGM